MPRKLFIFALGALLFSLNEAKSEYYECYLSTDLKKLKPLGKNPIRGFGGAGESVCEEQYPQECKNPKCLFKVVESSQRPKFF